ncbi:MAG: hypothetical protein QXF45_05065 [Candidatus Caldarchaeum sp.]
MTATEKKLERLSWFIHKIENAFRAGGLELSGVKVVAEKDGEKVSYSAVDRMRKLSNTRSSGHIPHP